MRLPFCDATVARARRRRDGLPDRRPRLHGARAAAARDGRPLHQRRRRRAEHDVGGRRPRRGRASRRGRTASRRSAMRVRSSRSATTSRSTNLPVKLVGNGGGYGYGVMGPTPSRDRGLRRVAVPAEHDGVRAGVRRGRGVGGRPGRRLRRARLPAARPRREAVGLRRPRLRAMATAHVGRRRGRRGGRSAGGRLRRRVPRVAVRTTPEPVGRLRAAAEDESAAARTRGADRRRAVAVRRRGARAARQLRVGARRSTSRSAGCRSGASAICMRARITSTATGRKATCGNARGSTPRRCSRPIALP